MAGNSNPSELLTALLPDWHLLLQGWSASDRLTAAAEEALLLNGEPQALKELVTRWSAGDFSGLPPIVLLPSSSMPGAAGAYAISTGTIYLNQDWLTTASAAQAMAVLTEELGHHLDGLLNVVDTPGDEGEYFSNLLRRDALMDSQKEGLRAENDSGAIIVSNKTLEVEYVIQAPSIQPIKQFPKAGDNFARKSSSDGTYIYVPSITSGVASLSKYDLTGGLIWERNLDQGGGWPSSSAVASDGSILVATGSDGLSGKISTLARFSSTGNKIWEANNSNQRYGQDIAIEGNTVYISGGTGAGFSNSNIAFVNAYSLSTGSLLWSKTYANSGAAFINDLEINNGRIYCSATPYGKVNFDIAIAGCLDLNGNEIWWRSAPAPDWNGIWTIRVVGSQLIGTGYKADGGDRGNTRLISFNTSDGTILWDTSWGDNNQQGSGAIEVLNGKIYVAYGDGVPWNSSAISGGYSAVTELDTAGNPLNTYTYDVPNSYDGASELVKVGDSLFLLGQTTGAIAGQANGGGYDIYLASVVKAVAPIIRGNSLYTIVDGLKWTQAEANSVKLGGHLVTINDADERRWLSQNIYGNPLHIDRLKSNIQVVSDLDGYFVGLNDKAINGNLEWAGGANVSWTPSEYIHPAYYADSGYLMPGFEYGAVHSNSDGLAPDIVFNLGDNHLYYASDGILYSGIAEIPFIRRGDSAYVIVQGPTWEEAEANAVKLGGHLVTINDAAENQWLVDQYYGSTKLSESLETPSIWIGLNDLAIESSWVWSSGEILLYSNWAPGEPDGTNYYKAGEEYAELVLFDSYNRDPGQWGDNANNSILNKYGIAEIKLAPNNIPTGTPTLSGTFNTGQTISIDKTLIQDVDNFTGWTPTYSYAWEASTDNGTTWSRLTSTDGIDNNSTYTLTSAEVGKKVRGVVSYVDGYGSKEAVASDSSSVIITSLSPANSHLFTNITRLNWSESLQSFVSSVTYSNANFLLAEVPGSGQPFQGDKDGNLNAKTWEKVRFGDLSGEHLPIFTDSSYYYYYGAVNIGSLGGWGLFLTNQNDEFYLLDIDGNCNLSPGTNVGSWDSWLPNTYYFATNVVCFVAGTQIRTPQGDRAIETIQPGDLISTTNGVKPIKFVSRNTRQFNELLAVGKSPIRVAASAFGAAGPTADLLMSPSHALCLEGTLIEAAALLDHDGVSRVSEWQSQQLTYFNIELEQHELIWANGALTESYFSSYRTNGFSRQSWDNFDEYRALYGDGELMQELPMPRIPFSRQLPAALRAKLQINCVDLDLAELDLFTLDQPDQLRSNLNWPDGLRTDLNLTNLNRSDYSHQNFSGLQPIKLHLASQQEELSLSL